MDIQPIENSIKFGGQNATYDVSNESPNAAEFVASFNLVPANDVDGQLRVHVASGSREIALNACSGNGTGGTIRLNKFFTDGIGAPLNQNPATITGTIFAQTIQIGNQYQPINIGVDTPYGVDWVTADTGAGGLVRFQQDVISDIDFNGTAAQITIADGKNVGGAVVI
ncbi:hypothetical protein N7280_01475 [Rickettsia rhipicephali]|uniref:hypothetical protein n=1 Tax=Rickettsia rhipicephali TaxID=33992 RepID=UPI00225B2074|nr:hypothetical protein [Rickettsia rhipicephali]MCX4079325.1 hypothetical protein [Rickettsia rhipicephali]